MMQKIHYQTDQEQLLEACGGHMSELIETDSGVKSAASDLITRDILEQHRPDDDHFLIHCVAMGDTETYGPNKNADGWSKQALEARHQTFVTNGHMFREHRNRDPKKKIGDIKYAAYSPIEKGGMGRVELLMWGNKKKAEEEYEMAKQGKELSFSMSARVKKDVCNCCGHEASNPMNYCSHMKEARLQYLPDFKKYAFVWNPEPTFFDNSRVTRPADRVARYLEYKFGDDDMAKAASQDQVILGTEWAEYEGLSLPDTLVRNLPEGQLKQALEQFEELEKVAHLIRLGQEESMTQDYKVFVKTASLGTLGDNVWSHADMDKMRQMEPGTFFREMAKRAMVMPFETFYSYALGKDPKSIKEDNTFNKSAGMLPGIMGALLKGFSPDLGGMCCAGGQLAADSDPANTDEVQQLMDKADEEFGVCPSNLRQRGMKITIHHMSNPEPKVMKVAAEDLSEDENNLAHNTAHAYGLYQIQALQDIKKLAFADMPDKKYQRLQEAILLNNQKYRKNTVDA